MATINVTILRCDATFTFFQETTWRRAAEKAIKECHDEFQSSPGFKIFMAEVGVSSRPEEHTAASLSADLIDGKIPA
jgi:hypothetical protein